MTTRFIGRALLAALFFRPTLPAATIFLVRHADRASTMSADALLSPAGEERAKLLAQILRDANVQRIFVTEVRRVQQTAAPLADKLHIAPTVIPQKDVDALVKQLRELGENGTALVVGHSNTVPKIAEMLGAGPIPAPQDSEYDRLLVITTMPGGKAKAVTLRYGNPAQ